MSMQTDLPRQVDAAKTLRSLLPAYGLAVEDFDFEAHESSGFPELFGVPGGILTVRCRSTGEERLYATGAESWIGAFMLDVGSGLFGPFPKIEP